MAHSFHIHSREKHFKWSAEVPPVLTVPSGAEITFELHDGGNNQIRPDNATTALRDFDFAQGDPGHGPVFIEGAEPGDILKIEFLDIRTADYGWTAILPGFGILSDEFPEPQLKIWDLKGARERGYVVFKEGGIHVPFSPFLGLVGVAPAPGVEHGMIPPQDTGGNLDTRHMTVGSALYLPVRVPGALLSAGDGHAAQGDGEVCGTAIETPCTARVRVTVQKREPGKGAWAARGPYVVTAPRAARPEVRVGEDGSDGSREFVYLGIDSDLREATRKAVRGAVDWLHEEKGLERAEAYMLASVAGSLRMCEVVDLPNYVIGFAIPLGIFVN
ncbi:acetamidase/formamidase family protein [Xylariales sp. PMI_506]|nr:acetamidase/formamidase family protein [Xylariales sp. PMI_506]